MTWSRQQRHKARAAAPARCARITGLAGDGSACVPGAGIHATSCPLWEPAPLQPQGAEARAAATAQHELAMSGFAGQLPAHLREDAETLGCNRCGRRSVAVRQGDDCGMTQPGGGRCRGIFLPDRPMGDPQDMER